MECSCGPYRCLDETGDEDDIFVLEANPKMVVSELAPVAEVRPHIPPNMHATIEGGLVPRLLQYEQRARVLAALITQADRCRGRSKAGWKMQCQLLGTQRRICAHPAEVMVDTDVE